MRPFAREALVNMAFLHEPPLLLGAVEPSYRTINGSLWTISYEARCYGLVAVLWMVGLFPRRGAVAAITMAACLAAVAASDPASASAMDALASGRLAQLAIGLPHWDVIYGAAFLVGVTVYLYRDDVLHRLTGLVALIAAAALSAGLRWPPFAIGALIVLGAPVIFWLGWRARMGAAQRINDAWDISYGTYLYGWPCTIVIKATAPGLPIAAAAIAALLLAWTFGAASWWGVERWFRWPSRKPVRTVAAAA